MIREIEEELDVVIRVGQRIGCVEYDYPAFHLSMECFWAEIISGELILKEHEAAKWLSRDELDRVEWLPADLNETDINPPAELGRLADASGDKRSTRI